MLACICKRNIYTSPNKFMIKKKDCFWLKLLIITIIIMPHFYCTKAGWFCFSLYAAVVFSLHNSPAGNCTNHATLNAAIKKKKKKRQTSTMCRIITAMWLLTLLRRPHSAVNHQLFINYAFSSRHDWAMKIYPPKASGCWNTAHGFMVGLLMALREV